MSDATCNELGSAFPALSKRGVRRLIQRAFVLVGRNRSVRQQIREIELTTLWVLEDCQFDWTVMLDHGKIEFHRGHAAKPHLTFVWPTAEGFFKGVENGVWAPRDFKCSGNVKDRKYCAPVHQAFCGALRELLRNPVDDDGERLL